MTSDTRNELMESAPSGSSPVRPSFCMINYNGEAVLREALGAAMRQAHLFCEMLLVDNGSSDGSVALVTREFPAVRVVRLPENGGAGAARNAGFREARSDVILCLDNDVAVAEGCLQQLVEALERHPGAVVAMPAVVYAHRREVIQYAGAGSHYLGLMTLHQQDRPLADADRRVCKVASVVTCAFLVDRSRLGDAAPFDEAFFYQMEDHDFGVRLRARGLEVLAVPGAVVFHGKGTEGMSIRHTGDYSSARVYYLIRNRWLFLLKNYGGRTLLVLAPMLLVYETVQLAMVLKKGWTAEWARAGRWVLGHRRQIAAERRRVQGLRRLPDRTLLENGPVPFRDEMVRGRLERLGRRALDAMATVYWKGAVRLL
ncbi:glycosyltransferase family 2 protein [Geminicoccaceae bacterium 1502E]|nr:glycosyltransferase family 2 protein [Geminicoccaceae bacterium 1502E]